MKTSNTQAQTEQNTPKFNPDFSHRLSALYQYQGDKDFTTANLNDSIMLMSERAAAVIHVVQSLKASVGDAL